MIAMDEKNNAVSDEKPKRKTHTSTAVKRRYNNKVYSRVYADLPKELVTAVKKKIWQTTQQRQRYSARR